MSISEVAATVSAVWRIESARVTAALTRITRDLGLAEEIAHDAVVAALRSWPSSGIPANPGAWLMTTAKHRAIDVLRRRARIEVDSDAARDAVGSEELDLERLDDDIGDDVLRLVFMACHPILPTDARVTLTLRVVAGLSTDEIARAFLTSEPTIAQRIVRAKRTLAEAGIAPEIPRGDERIARLESVLEVLYLIFNEGYTATAGTSWLRPALCEDAMRLARILVGLVPDEAEAHGLVALLELQASRNAARVGADGEPVLLLEQNRARWDRLLIHRGLAALAIAESLSPLRGPYTLQAAIAACHARASTADATDWPRIAALYTALVEQLPSPVIELNRAVAIGMAFGPSVALPLVDALGDEPSLAGYHLLPSVRGDLLAKLGRIDEARAELQRAADLARNTRERELLLGRIAALATQR